MAPGHFAPPPPAHNRDRPSGVDLPPMYASQDALQSELPSYLTYQPRRQSDATLVNRRPIGLARYPRYPSNTADAENSEDDDSEDDSEEVYDSDPESLHTELDLPNSSHPTDEENTDPRDSHITAKDVRLHDGDPEWFYEKLLRQLPHAERKKERMRTLIEFHVVPLADRQVFILKFASALMTFGAPSHRVESQLLNCAHTLDVAAEFIHIPGVIMCSFGDAKAAENHLVKCRGGLDLGNLHRVHQIYREVVEDQISAITATVQLHELLNKPPIYSSLSRLALAFALSALICPLAFGGSIIDMGIAGVGAVVISFMRFMVSSKSHSYANLFEVTMAMLMSFCARALSSIKGDLFCYSAISSGAIVGILPGYLILRSSLELASKNVVCGSINMVYALFYTLCLGFSIQMGSDIYLIVDRSARRDLETLAAKSVETIDLAGIFSVNDSGSSGTGISPNGHFTYSSNNGYKQEDMFEGCFRPASNPWYLGTLPSWTKYPIVVIFSVLSSLENMQPWRTWELVVMVVISCAAYFANIFANYYIFERSDIVSAIGAFVVGVLGNIYSQKMGGTAFTSMVTGVLFLVPSGLSQAGGMTVGNSVDIGGSMIAVTIGITVGLFVSQAVVYTVGSRKDAATFSF